MRAFAAGRALAATFVGEKPTTVVQKIDHRIGFVEYRDAAGAQSKTADPLRRGEIQRHVELRFRDNARAKPAQDGRLGRPPATRRRPARRSSRAHGDAQRGLVAAGPVDVPAQAEQFRAEAAGIAGIFRLGRDAHRTEPRRAAIDDVFDAGDRLDVVDDGWFSKSPSTAGNGG